MSTLQDVAREAGVSSATVSRVLNNTGKVSAATRRRVEEAIARLGYRPSRVARRLRVQRGRSHILGLMIPDIQNPFFSDVARGVEDFAYDHDYAVILCSSDEDPRKQSFYLNIMRAESVDGVILPPIPGEQDLLRELAEREGLPIVCLDRRADDLALDTVVVDNRRGAFEAVDLLLRLGHRRIGFITGLPGLSTTRERLEGYLAAFEAHALPVPHHLIREGDSRYESGREQAEALLALPVPPTALFVGNNLMTLGALEALHRRRLPVPEAISIIGFDDFPWASSLNPPLTTVRQPGYAMGRRAAELLLRRIAQPGRPAERIICEPELVPRASCAPPPPGPGDSNLPL
ncbi:MAG: LacI family transcriptional regulator [Rhodothermaceae bacterium]|nr:MAG: LacI family transcriptional regulator [Rhodothermaceae bacterium]